MNTTTTIQTKPSANLPLTRACIASCQKLIAQIGKTKDAILAEYRETRLAHEHLLQLALTEAEALAWQTGFPQLVFPTLAREKAESVVAWETHQRSISRMGAALWLAA